MREILAALERVYCEALPQLNLRRWAGSIYTWLTRSVLDPANSGRVTMNYLMKLVKAALEWSYETQSTDVLVEMLEKAATLLVLRRETLRIIDGAGPRIDISQAPSEQGEHGNKTERETKPEQETAQATIQAEQRDQAEEEEPLPTTANCAFSGKLVPIDLKRFTDSGINLVECASLRKNAFALPHEGRPPVQSAHPSAGQQTPLTEKRWSATGKTDWDVVGE